MTIDAKDHFGELLCPLMIGAAAVLVVGGTVVITPSVIAVRAAINACMADDVLPDDDRAMDACVSAKLDDGSDWKAGMVKPGRLDWLRASLVRSETQKVLNDGNGRRPGQVGDR